MGGNEMLNSSRFRWFAVLAAAALAASVWSADSAVKPRVPNFHTSDRCVACHNGLVNARGRGHLHRPGLASDHDGQLPRGIPTGTPACGAKRWIIPNRARQSRMNARSATCPWRRFESEVQPAMKARFFLISASCPTTRATGWRPTAFPVRCATRSEKKSWARGRALWERS